MDTKATRCGKHREGKSSIGLYVDDDTRALLALTADQLGMTGTDILISGIKSKATEAGILRDGKVVDRFATAIEMIKAEIIEMRMERRKTK